MPPHDDGLDAVRGLLAVIVPSLVLWWLIIWTARRIWS